MGGRSPHLTWHDALFEQSPGDLKTNFWRSGFDFCLGKEDDTGTDWKLEWKLEE
jgi:hypothetical protein